MKRNVERFCEFFVLLARSFEFTKTPRESFLAPYDRYLAHPASHTPHKELASILRAVVDCEGLYVIRLSWGRRMVNLLPVAQRTNAFTNGVVDRP